MCEGSNLIIRLKVHRALHGRERDMESATMMRQSIHHGGHLRNGVNNDRGNGLAQIGTHGMQAHGPHRTRPGRETKEILGRGKDQVMVEANVLRLGGNVRITRYQYRYRYRDLALAAEQNLVYLDFDPCGG